MITVLQRVSKGDVTIFGKICGAIQNGLVIFLGVMKDDTEKDIVFLTKKISGFRIFNDEKEKMNLSIKDINGSILVISQFTLCGDWKKADALVFSVQLHQIKGNIYMRSLLII